ncbi:outer membrane lipoprotein chaperone LolA [Thiohalobacter sp. IOR34]|uniref:outer membrane lipoprotein chaperone LolA n=1 Tax=Thiohalobacter sp. IOR34 TaxID=3057176 RepID=UPI0025B1B9D2|nr:outer membrane lipoprotein chaperone LolA [Thiohalobacter sp. IOR34]WJW74380.1 outer membrane lipoprotein chaperone LolA [Thiohalobacter sp. IOR34]
MPTRTFILLFALLAGLAQPLAATENGPFDRFFDGLQAYRAGFEQTQRDAYGEILQQAAGRVAIKRPGRFRWDYEQPYQQLILGDGERLWSYDADLEQVTVRPQREALDGTPAVLLSDGRNPRRLFEVRRLAVAGKQTRYELRPRSEERQFERIRLDFEGDMLSGMTLVDGFGQVTEIRFLDPERNPPLDDALFRFQPPPGVDVIGE